MVSKKSPLEQLCEKQRATCLVQFTCERRINLAQKLSQLEWRQAMWN